MKIRSDALLGAAAWGIAIQLIAEVVSSVVAITAALPDSTVRPLPTVDVSVLGPIGGLTLLNCGAIMLVDLAIGVWYVILHQREAPISVNNAAYGGSAAVTVAHLVSGFFGLLITALLTYLLTRANPASTAALGGGVANGLRIIVLLLLGSVLGSIGGVLGTAVFRRRGLTTSQT